MCSPQQSQRPSPAWLTVSIQHSTSPSVSTAAALCHFASMFSISKCDSGAFLCMVMEPMTTPLHSKPSWWMPVTVCLWSPGLDKPGPPGESKHNVLMLMRYYDLRRDDENAEADGVWKFYCARTRAYMFHQYGIAKVGFFSRTVHSSILLSINL